MSLAVGRGFALEQVLLKFYITEATSLQEIEQRKVLIWRSVTTSKKVFLGISMG